MNSARIGVLLNVLVILAVTLNINPAERIDLPLYPLTKTANIGKLSARLDAAYQVVLIVSALVYLSLAVRILLTCFRKASFKIRRTGGAILCLVLCLSLCGCYDGNEVEENAYAVAVGVDKERKRGLQLYISNIKSARFGGKGRNQTGRIRNKTMMSLMKQIKRWTI